MKAKTGKAAKTLGSARTAKGKRAGSARGAYRPGRPMNSKNHKQDFIDWFEGLILSGKYEAGQKLPSERELADSLDVSRPVVHDALNELASRGLVRVEPRRGVFAVDWRREGSAEMLISIMRYADVDRPDGEKAAREKLRAFEPEKVSPQLMESFLEARVYFENELARLAARRRTEDSLADLEKTLAKEELVDKKVPHKVTELDYEFHLNVAIASGNVFYPLLMNSLRRIYENILDRFYTDEAVVPTVFKLHKSLVAAISAKKEKEAEAIMNEILEYGENNLRRILVGKKAVSGAKALNKGAARGRKERR